jgi:hypothetical protein
MWETLSSLKSSCIFYPLGFIMAWVNLAPTLEPWLKPPKIFLTPVYHVLGHPGPP